MFARKIRLEHPWRSVRPSCHAPGPERFVPSSGRITLEGECGERLVLLGREEDWYLEGRRLFECECGERLTITKNRVSEEATQLFAFPAPPQFSFRIKRRLRRECL